MAAQQSPNTGAVDHNEKCSKNCRAQPCRSSNMVEPKGQGPHERSDKCSTRCTAGHAGGHAFVKQSGGGQNTAPGYTLSSLGVCELTPHPFPSTISTLCSLGTLGHSPESDSRPNIEGQGGQLLCTLACPRILILDSALQSVHAKKQLRCACLSSACFFGACPFNRDPRSSLCLIATSWTLVRSVRAHEPS
eukprot:scaffold146257_cov20-Tisochrysis_lutea.AAC.1